MESAFVEDGRQFQHLDTRFTQDNLPLEVADPQFQGIRPTNGITRCDLRKSLAWNSAFFTSPGVLEPEELFATANFPDSRAGGHDSRGSLAWDTAFFTNPGVLEPEELRVVNGGFKNGDAHETTENMGKSIDLDSAYSLASLETDLFKDLRCCFHRTNEETGVSHPRSQSGRGKRTIHTSKGKYACAGRKNHSPPCRRQQTCSRLSHAKAQKESSRTPQSQVKKTIEVGKANSLSCPKPPKASQRAEPPSVTPLKRASAVSKHVKMTSQEDGNTLKKRCVRESSRTRMGLSPVTASSWDFSTSSSRLSKSDSRLTASDSNLKTPLRCGRGRIEPWSSLLSSPGSSSCVSTPMKKNMSHLSSSMRRPEDNTMGSPSERHGNQRRVEQERRITSSGSPKISKDTSRSSRLQVPSPKLGFFDTMKQVKPDRQGRRLKITAPGVPSADKPSVRTLSSYLRISVGNSVEKMSVSSQKPHRRGEKGVKGLQIQEDKENLEWLNIDELSRRVGAVDLHGRK